MVEERINRRLVFNQPAGHVEQGETLLAAVIREAREETAWRFEPQLASRRLSVAQSRQRPLDPAFRIHRPGETITTPRSRSIGASSRTHWLTPAELDGAAIAAAQPAGAALRARLSGRPRHSLGTVAELDLQSAASLTAGAPLNGSARVTAVGI